MSIAANGDQSWASAGRQPRIAIIGAGMSGIAAVVELRKAGYTDLTVYEKADRVGGTWRENTYPGLSCDIPSRWYSFRFALNPDWSHRFSYGPEIQAYMERVARDFDVESAVRFNTPVKKLDYEAPNWRLVTESGEESVYDIVIGATGILHKPVRPDIEGLDSFEGICFHSARWDHSVDLAGKRVGIIGTGSTAAQIIGEITDKVGEMVVFQRTPQWMIPLPQKRYSDVWKRVLKVFPFLQWLPYYFYYLAGLRTFGAATVGNKKMQRRISKSCQDNLDTHVADPELRAKLTPDYQAACKRLIFCSDFYPAITRDNADLVTDPIERITPKGVQTVDGKTHELDVLGDGIRSKRIHSADPGDGGARSGSREALGRGTARPSRGRDTGISEFLDDRRPDGTGRKPIPDHDLRASDRLHHRHARQDEAGRTRGHHSQTRGILRLQQGHE